MAHDTGLSWLPRANPAVNRDGGREGYKKGHPGYTRGGRCAEDEAPRAKVLSAFPPAVCSPLGALRRSVPPTARESFCDTPPDGGNGRPYRGIRRRDDGRAPAVCDLQFFRLQALRIGLWERAMQVVHIVLRYLEDLTLREWLWVLIGVVVVGVICLRGFGSRSSY